MADLKNEEKKHALPAKRKADLTTKSKYTDNEAEDLTNKQKLHFEEKKIEDNDDEEEEFEGEDTYTDTDEDDDESEDEDEHSNGETQIERKGKMKEDKGKRKLIEESDDSSEAESESDGDSDLSDDPLAEVDLDNILPSRSRNRGVQLGVYIRNDLSKDNADDSNA